MGKVKKLFREKSIKNAFMSYMLICILSALFLSLLLSELCQLGQEQFIKNIRRSMRIRRIISKWKVRTAIMAMAY